VRRSTSRVCKCACPRKRKTSVAPGIRRGRSGNKTRAAHTTARLRVTTMQDPGSGTTDESCCADSGVQRVLPISVFAMQQKVVSMWVAHQNLYTGECRAHHLGKHHISRGGRVPVISFTNNLWKSCRTFCSQRRPHLGSRPLLTTPIRGLLCAAP